MKAVAQLAGYIIFDAGVNPPVVRDAYGVGAIVVTTPLQQFIVTPSDAVTGGGLVPGSLPATATRGMMLPVASITSAPAAGTTRILSLGETAGVGVDLNVCDATGALANAAAGDTIAVLFFKCAPTAA
jgi:hypothetical protein